jgi:hypothetical protein
MPVPLPPWEEQLEIVRRVRALFRTAEVIEARVAAGTTRAARLKEAVLSRAFSGELVPTEAELARAEGREYEPAAELLRNVADNVAAKTTEDGSGKRTTARRRQEVPGRGDQRKPPMCRRSVRRKRAT